jgi:hypothetical protein
MEAYDNAKKVKPLRVGRKHFRVLGLILAFLGVLLVLTWSAAHADPITVAPFDPSFNHGQPLRLNGGRIVFSSPTLADVDGDHKLDIVVGGSDGVVYVVKSTGELLWSYQVAQSIDPLVSKPTGTSVIRGAISVADINNDGYPEVVVPVGEIDQAEHLPNGQDVNGALVVLDHTGKILPGWPVITRDHWGQEADGYSDGVPASPALGDLDGSGYLDVVAVSFDQQVNVWHHDGTPALGWPKFVRDTPWSPVGLADLDNDGNLEIVALLATQYEPTFGTVQGGDLRIYRRDGRLVCKYSIDQAFTSAPAIADLDGDGKLEIVAGTGDWYEGTGRGWQVYAWNANCGVRPGWPVSTNNYMTSAPALADLDGDGKLEVIATSATTNHSTLDPRVYAWRQNGAPVPGFPSIPRNYRGETSDPLSPIAADWNADGRPEIFTSLGWEVGVLGANGVQYSYWPGGPASAETFWARYTLNNTSAVGDIDNDGRLELVVASVATEGDPSTGGIFVYEAPASGGKAAWPMLGADAVHSHVYPRTLADDARISGHTIPAVMSPGAGYDAEVAVRNTGTSSWTKADGYGLKAAYSGDQLRTVDVVPLDPALTIRPGEVARFKIRLQAPQQPGYYPTEWRMSRNGTEFGLKVNMKVKVGNDPAIYVLARDATRSPDRTSIYPGGLAEPIPAPKDAATWYQNGLWKSAVAFDVMPDGSGYHVITAEGYTTWSEDTPELGRAPYSQAGLWTGLRLTPAGTAFFAIDRNGQLRFTEATELLSGVPIGTERGLTMLPGLSPGQVRDMDVTADGKGLLVVDRRGRAYAFGSAPNLPAPAGLPFSAGEAIARRIRLTLSGGGYYILDNYGRLWRTGDAQPLEAHYGLHIGEDWARDFELTADGQGYYLIDCYGHVYNGGSAPALMTNLPPIWDTDQAVDLFVLDDRKAPASITLSQNAVDLIATPEGIIPSVRIEIKSADSGGSELQWEAHSNPQPAWLVLSPSAGNTPSALVVSVPKAPPVGTYSATIDVMARTADGELLSSRSVSLSLRVVNKLDRVLLPSIMSAH